MHDIRRLSPDEGDLAAALHRTAGALIPGYATQDRTPESFREFYRREVMPNADVWAAFAEDRLLGFVALLPGWIDHLYVDPDHHRQGVGGALVRLAQEQQDELRLHTFQANTTARRLHERHGFVVEELTDGDRNEEMMPDVSYCWRQSARTARLGHALQVLTA